MGGLQKVEVGVRSGKNRDLCRRDRNGMDQMVEMGKVRIFV